MRVAIGGVFQETSTYATELRGAATLDSFEVRRGEDLLDHNRDTATEMGGAIEAAARLGVTLVPTVLAIASPGPTIDATTYQALRDELVSSVAAVVAAGCDAILLVLHGAGVAEGIDSIEVDLVRRLRNVVGDLPMAATLDLHGNLGDEWSTLIDVSVPCRLYPHTDIAERADDAIVALTRIVREHLVPVTANVAVPVLCTNGRTDEGPMAAAVQWCTSAAADPGVLDVSILHGFPYTDVPDNGMHVLVTRGDGDHLAARLLANELADRLWQQRTDLRATALGAREAVQAALAIAATTSRPVVVNENSDNPGGGAPGDGTHLLRAMLVAGVTNSCFGCIADPRAALAAHTAGVGATIRVELGGHHGSLHGPPIVADAEVRAVSDGEWVAVGPIATGAKFSLGPSACLRIDGVDVVVSTRSEQLWDTAPFVLHGIDPTRRSIVAVKSSTHFRASFASMAEAIVTADPPGLTALDVTCLPRHRNRSPLWPLDPDANPLHREAGN